jgi:hypothetical protein
VHDAAAGVTSLALPLLVLLLVTSVTLGVTNLAGCNLQVQNALRVHQWCQALHKTVTNSSPRVANMVKP